jgi:hypothetical protein
MSCDSGDPPELTVAEVLKVFLPEYLGRYSLPAHHLKVLRRLAQCRSGALGWTVWQCQQCTAHIGDLTVAATDIVPPASISVASSG